MSANPFHSRWYRVWHYTAAPLRLLGFTPVLVRCRWTKAQCRVGLSWVGVKAAAARAPKGAVA